MGSLGGSIRGNTDDKFDGLLFGASLESVYGLAIDTNESNELGFKMGKCLLQHLGVLKEQNLLHIYVHS